MTTVTISLDDWVAAFYRRLADSVKLPPEQVLSDALFKLAGELSMEALRKAE